MSGERPDERVLATWERLSSRSKARPLIRRTRVRARGGPLSAAGLVAAMAVVAAVVTIGVVGLGRPVAPGASASTGEPGSAVAVGPSGSSFVPSASPDEPSPSAVSPRPPWRDVSAGSLVTALDGWALLNDGTGSLFVTHDGGRSWGLTTPPAPGERVMNAAFADALHGWVAGTIETAQGTSGVLVVNIHRTDDGGTTWSTVELARVPSPGPDPMVGFPTFSVLSADRVFVMLGLADFGPHVSQLFVTTDAGRSWEQRSGVTEVGSSAFLDETHGWAIRGDTAALVRTVDGGRTWRRAVLPKILNGDPFSVFASIPVMEPDGGLLMTMSSGRDGDPTFIVTSGDGGSSWAINGQAPAGAYGWITATADGTWILGGSPPLRSHDKGATWEPTSSSPPTGVGGMTVTGGTHLSAIVWTTPSCGPTADCFVPRELWISDDAGNTWRNATP